METKTIIEETEDTLIRFLKFSIRFSESNTTYSLNNRWVNEIDEFYFMNEAKKVKYHIVKQLRHGLRHEEYLICLVGQVWKRLEYLQKYMHNTPDIIKEFKEIINPERMDDEPLIANISIYDEFINNVSQFKSQDSDRFNYLMLVSKYLNNYETKLDFQCGLLLYAIKKYYKEVNDLHSYLLSLSEKARYIDFKNLTFEGLKESSFDRQNNQLCHFNLAKKGVAQLFRILLEERIVVFDEKDDRNNELQMKRFAQINFTYQHPVTGVRTLIETFNREYSEACNRLSPEKERHEKFIDNLITILKQRKANLQK